MTDSDELTRALGAAADDERATRADLEALVRIPSISADPAHVADVEASADAVALVPGERLLVETDSPFLSPPGAPRGRNQPGFVAITADWVAERRGVGEDSIEALGDALVAVYDATFPRSLHR